MSVNTVTTDFDTGLSPNKNQAIIWTKFGVALIAL